MTPKQLRAVRFLKGEAAMVFATRGPRCATMHRARHILTCFGHVWATCVVTWSYGIMCHIHLLINKLNQACFGDHHHHHYWGSNEPRLFILDSRGLTSHGTVVLGPPEECQESLDSHGLQDLRWLCRKCKKGY